MGVAALRIEEDQKKTSSAPFFTSLLQVPRTALHDSPRELVAAALGAGISYALVLLGAWSPSDALISRVLPYLLSVVAVVTLIVAGWPIASRVVAARAATSELPILLVLCVWLSALLCSCSAELAEASKFSISAVSSLLIYTAARRLIDTFKRTLRERAVHPLLFPRTAVRVIEGGAVSRSEQVDLEQVKVGDLLRVSARDVVPLDGTVVSGSAELFELFRSGVPRFRLKSIDDEVYAGSSVRAGTIELRVSAPAEDSECGTFLSKLVEAHASEPFGRSLRSVVVWHSLVLLFVATSAVLFWNERGASWPVLVAAATAVLCCSFIPEIVELCSLAVRSTLSTLFTSGVVVRDAAVLARLGAVTRVVFGTREAREEDAQEVKRFTLIDQRIDERSLWAVVLALIAGEACDEYPALLEFAQRRIGEDRVPKVVRFKRYPGRGVCGLIEGSDFTLGSEDLLLERGVHIEASEIEAAQRDEQVVLIAMGDQVIAQCTLGSVFPEQIRAMVHELDVSGIRPGLAGEGNAEAVDALAQSLGIERAYAFGGMTRTLFLEKLKEMPGALVVGLPADDASVRCERFDELRWNLDEAQVILTVPASRVLAHTLAVAAELREWRTKALRYSVAGSFVLLVVACAPLLSPVFVLALSLALVVASGATALLSLHEASRR